MGQILASDLDNRNFVNPQNPDTLLSVEFFMHNPKDKWASDEASYKEGRKVEILKYKDPVPFVRITAPGDNTSTIVQQVREDHKRRFPQQWMAFQIDQGLLDEGPVVGWKIEEWDHLNENQIRDLKHLRFNTVEQIAGASDAQIQGLGMMGQGLRIEARKALEDTLKGQIKAEAEQKDKQIADLTAKMEKMAKQLEEMSKPVKEPVKDKK